MAPYHFRIEENVRPDTAVGQVQATDPDIGLNAKVYYHILEGTEIRSAHRILRFYCYIVPVLNLIPLLFIIRLFDRPSYWSD